MNYLFNKTDKLIGDSLSLASNEVAPVIAPYVIQSLWKNKWKLVIIFFSTFFFLIFALEALALQSQALSRDYVDELPPEYRDGVMQIPYGNPIGLERRELVLVTSSYNAIRIINGVRDVHRGLDLVPSSLWFKENPGKTSTDVINRSIIAGRVSNFIDSAGALCSYVTNDVYRTLYCHCNAFISLDQALVKYGDPICFMGTTGRSTGVHTHIEIFQRNNNSWLLIDPTPFLFPQINQ